MILREGVRYSMRVGVINNVGYLVLFEINGVVIDIFLLIVSIMIKFCLFCCIYYLILFERSLIIKVLGFVLIFYCIKYLY